MQAEGNMKNRAKDEALLVKVFNDTGSLAKAAAEHAARSIRQAVRENGCARILAATGTSQFEFLDALTKAPDVDWTLVEMFHLDEYIGLPITHPASFRKILLERLIQKTGITSYHLLDADHDPLSAIRRVGEILAAAPINVALVGIGENPISLSMIHLPISRPRSPIS